MVPPRSPPLAVCGRAGGSPVVEHDHVGVRRAGVEPRHGTRAAIGDQPAAVEAKAGRRTGAAT
ncbi:MAG: hypothetical protein IT372_10740 [Polyangiaceae bacterium]|nr:hypothetical protein [Polyangiaceae bacterium]